MKRITHTLAMALAAAALYAAPGQPLSLQSWRVGGASLDRQGALMSVDFDIDFSALDVPSEEAMLFTPVIRNAESGDSIVLPSVGVYGRNRYYHYERRGQGMLAGGSETSIRNKDKGADYAYQQVLPYEDWMNGAWLTLNARCYGCCFHILGQNDTTLVEYFHPDFSGIAPAYIQGSADEVVEKQLEGSALIQFVVDRTEVKPDWRDNYRELGKITHSIDTVKADPDFTIVEVWLKGFASPESPYAHNTDLARGRVQSVKEYVQNLYRFEPGIIITDYEPEDWAGLRRYVDASNMDNRQGILDIIDNGMDPDDKEAFLKKTYPKDYAFLLANVYPPLRHTEYKIKYTVRHAADIDEIKQRIATDPSKLSINEFYLAANTYPRGSKEFNEVFDVCVRMYPNNVIANLNAANAALESGRLDDAERYLAKAGDSPEAEYSRGILLLQRERFAEALPLIQGAAAAGIPGADQVLANLQKVLSR